MGGPFLVIKRARFSFEIEGSIKIRFSNDFGGGLGGGILNEQPPPGGGGSGGRFLAQNQKGHF